MEEDIKGLNSIEVEARIREGKINVDSSPRTKTIKEIIHDNFFTYFNFLNLVLGLMIFVAGLINGMFLNALKNCLFMGVIITNTLISIIEEVISKKIIDKLSLLNDSKATVIRNGKKEKIDIYSLVLDDVIYLTLGSEIPSDSIVISGSIEVNESLLTGEPNSIKKDVDANLLSGSFVVSGSCFARITHVGKDNYASKITAEAKYAKPAPSVIMNSFTKMLKILSIMIIPVGTIMFIKEYLVTSSVSESVFTTVAALIGMIPEGLVLLTSSVMAVGVIKLYKEHVLVQELYAIESLARVDAIALDKTGTLTEGKMAVKDFVESKDYSKMDVIDYFKRYTYASEDTNMTMNALKDYFGSDRLTPDKRKAFSSEKKYSAVYLDGEGIFMGAPDVLFKDKAKDIEKYLEEYRVLALGKKKSDNLDDYDNLELIGFVLVEDVIRPSAKETLEYFKSSGVLVKIISGDNAKTVVSIAKKVGLNDATGIDIADLDEKGVIEACDKYDVLGRAKPNQKKWIIRHLKKQGHTVAMTGDGVNDVLALKESDCAISVKSGSDAARNVSKLILLNDDFNSLPKVVAEGRRTINNVERSGSLLLAKTLYTLFLILFSIVVPQKYFFIPIQLTFITAFTIGVPSFILALEPNNELVSGNFLLKIFAKALPAALIVVFNVALTSAFSSLFDLPYELQSTISVYLTTITGLLYLHKICTPPTILRRLLFTTMLIGFIIGCTVLPDFFNLLHINYTILLIVFVLSIDSFYIFKIFNYLISKIFHHFDKSIKVENSVYKEKVEA